MAYQVSLGNEAYEWPYKINYEKVNRIAVDVLVIGGGLAGAAAGIKAARHGAKVAVTDKAPIKRSGCGGTGLDHWNACVSNPYSPISPEDYMELPTDAKDLSHRMYITIKGSWDALMEMEKLGLPIRDEDGDFEGTLTENEDSKILMGFDYQNFINVKLRGGQYIKTVLYDGLRKENVSLYERVMMTSLLTENGKQGARVVGATGFSMETGEFYVFSAKTVIISTGYITGIWIYSTELTGHGYKFDPNEVGDGFAMAWKAGAQVIGMEKNGNTRGGHPFAWPRFGVGNPDNTWFPCTIVDNNGKEIPWEDVNGNILTTVEARNFAAEGQPFISSSIERPSEIRKPLLIHDLADRIKSGEYELPLWADLSGMPEKERRSIWGMMVGNEGKTRYTLYDYYTRNGFDPDQDMLWCPLMDPSHYSDRNVKGAKLDWFQGEPDIVKPWRQEGGGQGSLVTDWNLMTNIEGLFAAGACGSTGGAMGACTAGFYVGNRAAELAEKLTPGEISEEQVAAEHARVYAPVKRADDPNAIISWKELWGGMARVMQLCCGDFLAKSILEEGLDWMRSIENSEMQQTFARNPHELARVLECESRGTVSEVYLQSCIAKIDADKDPANKGKFMFNQLVGEKVISIFKEDKYWLKEPYAPTYLENYERCTAGERREQ